MIGPIAAASVTEAFEGPALMGLRYRRARHPAGVRADAQRALRTQAGWRGLLPTAHWVLDRTAKG